MNQQQLALELFKEFGIKEPDPRLLARLVAIIKRYGPKMVLEALNEYAQEDLLIQPSQVSQSPTGAKRGPKPGKKKDDKAEELEKKTSPPAANQPTISPAPDASLENIKGEEDKQ